MDVYQLFLLKANQWGPLKYKTLNQFEEAYFEVLKQGQNYGCSQIQFYLKPKDLYLKFGDEFLNKFRDFLIDIDPEKGRINSNAELNELITGAFGKQVVEILERHDEI